MLKIAFSPIYRYELPEGHRFPMAKYELLAEQLLWEGTVTDDNFFHPALLSEETALLTHTQDWWVKMNALRLSEKEIRAIGFPISAAFVRRGRHISQGTTECALFALQYGCAMNTAGGTHRVLRHGTALLSKKGRLPLLRNRDFHIPHLLPRNRPWNRHFVSRYPRGENLRSTADDY